MLNVDAVLVLQRSDVACLEQQREQFAGVPLLCIDPGILDAVVQAGLTDYQLRRLDVSASITARAYTQALSLAGRIDLALTDERQRLWGGEWLHGWDQSLLYLTLLRAYTQQALGRAMESSFPEARLGLLRPGNPAFFNWDAMLYTDIVGADTSRWSVVACYAHGRNWNPAVLDAAFDIEALQQQLSGPARVGGLSALTHIPTCFYDVRTFNDAITAAFEHNVDLPAVYCDVPVRRHGASLLRRLQPGDVDEICVRYQERARDVFRDALGTLVPNEPALRQQCEALARRSLLQAVAYKGLRQSLKDRPADNPLHLVISDHDVGFHGPLFSVAGEQGMDITVLPHSAYPTSVLPHAQRVTVIERSGVRTPVRTVLGAGVARRSVSFRSAMASVPRKAVKHVCLLLNTMLAEGLSYIEIFALIAFHRRLAALCARQGLTMVVRPKPGGPALSVLAGALSVPTAQLFTAMRQPLEEAAIETDLCIVFGEPTSAVSTFLEAGSYVLHVSQQDWPDDYLTSLPLKGTVVPSHRCESALAELQNLLSEPARYAELQSAQAAQYATRLRDSHASIFPAGSSFVPVGSPAAMATPARPEVAAAGAVSAAADSTEPAVD